ncbi:MAG TPA: TIM barrel protein [Pseudolabrys sp.]|nr:TIM barrel protein [Pseudolabrys sp.]
MKRSIATVSLSGSLDEKLAAIAEAKFAGVEIFENDLLSFNATPGEVRRMIGDLGLETVTLQPFRDFEGMPEPRRARNFARAERKFDLMGDLGCDLLMVCSNVSPDSLGGLDRAAADLRELGERAAKRGLRIGYEALAWGRHVNDCRDAWEIVRRADHPAVGLVLDSFHTLVRKTDLKAIANIPRERIFLVQLADAPLLDMDYLSWSRHFRSFPGQGDLAVLDFMRALATTGFDDWLSLEIFNDQFRAGSARRVAADGQRSLIYLLDELRLQCGKADTSLPPLPPRAKCQGVEFIEFALDETAAKDFTRLIAGLGFRKTGVHRSKSVMRWSQGEINLVVNTEKEGFAHSFNITHGTSVCAMALKVDDAAKAYQRAQQLLDRPFHQAVLPGELEIPAVRGLGGSLIYLVDGKSDLGRWWHIDFEATGEAERGGTLTAIDHVSQSMHYEEMLMWLLFYSSLLDVRKTPAQDVIDPGGIVRSQVLQTQDGSLRLILNASQSPRTLSSRFLNEAFGSGVQHIALATCDIMATLAHLRESGIEPLPIPENYYDDLEAKTDLPLERIAELKKANVLYDRDAEGEYLQAYTPTFGERFFFEIVERRGYQGLGAANAQIRLAAQARSSVETPLFD